MIQFAKASSNDSYHPYDRHGYQMDGNSSSGSGIKKRKQSYAFLGVNVQPLRIANLARIDEIAEYFYYLFTNNNDDYTLKYKK